MSSGGQKYGIATNRQRDFDPDRTPHPRVARAVDFTHAVCAQGREDLVGAEVRANRERHGYLLCTPARRRISSKKFITNVTCLRFSRASVLSAGINTMKRFPSGARSKFTARPMLTRRLPSQTRGLSGMNASPFT